jgi:hypothetical protein
MLVRAVLAAAIAALSVATAQAQTSPYAALQRFTGPIKAVSADHLVITASGGDVDLVVTPQTRVSIGKVASAAEIKPGAYLGTANLEAPDGGKATEVHLAESGPNVHFPMDKAGLMMTNGHVKSVTTTAKGEEFDLDYGAGKTRHVVLPPNTPVTRSVPGDLSMLKPGLKVTVSALPGPDGKLAARYVSIPDPAAKP